MGATAGARESQHTLVGRKIGGRYEVLTQLAAGGMATVYVARAQGVAGFERLVAVKVLHPNFAHEAEFVSMFLDEARLAARIHHPNVVSTLDVSDTDGDGFFLVMDYVEGDHLGALLQRAALAKQRLPAPVVARVLLDALSGLAAAHTLTDDAGHPLGIVHRDISPHNILVGVDGIARLTDFGVAKAEVRLSSTREGQFKGKLAYMAPEHAASGHADQRSDLFSMAIVAWESLTGRRLFRGENNAATLNKILHDPIPALSSVSASLAPFDDVIARALARDPDERYQTADDFALALESAAGTAVSTARGVSEVVRAHAGEKLASEKQRVKEAIELFGRSELREPSLPAPREGSGSSSRPRTKAEEENDEATRAARPATIQAAAAQSPPSRAPVLIVVALAVVAAIAGVVWWAVGSGGVATDAAGPNRAEPGESQVPAVVAAPAEPAAGATGSRAAATPEIAPPATEAEVPPPEGTDPAARSEATGASGQGTSEPPRRRAPPRKRGPSGGEEDDGSGDLIANPYRR